MATDAGTELVNAQTMPDVPRDPPERPWICKGCQKASRDKWLPAGWYTVQRSAGGAGRQFRLGMFCSLACLSDPGLEILETGPRSVALILATSTPTQPRNPVSLLNELAQVGHIRDVTWSVEVSGRGADQKHTAHVNTHGADGTPLTGNGTAPGRADARAAAAADLVATLAT